MRRVCVFVCVCLCVCFTWGSNLSSGGKWLSVAISAHSHDTVTLGDVPADASKLRYNWYSNPCGEHCFGCAVYAQVSPLGEEPWYKALSGEEPFLPLAPFVMEI